MKRVALPASLAVAVLFLSCGTSRDYFPMTPGSVWNYDSRTIIETYGAEAETTQTGTIRTEAVKYDRLLTGEDVVEFLSTSTIHVELPRETTYTITRTDYMRDAGDHILSYSSKDDQEPDTVMPIPLSKGATWKLDADHVMLALDQEDIAIQAGTYSQAWELQATMPTDTSYYSYSWFAADVGHVLTRTDYAFLPGQRIALHVELTSADIK